MPPHLITLIVLSKSILKNFNLCVLSVGESSSGSGGGVGASGLPGSCSGAHRLADVCWERAAALVWYIRRLRLHREKTIRSKGNDQKLFQHLYYYCYFIFLSNYLGKLIKRLSFRRINHKFSTVSTNKSVGTKVYSSSMSVNVVPKCGQMKGSVELSSWLFILVERLLLVLLVFEFCQVLLVDFNYCFENHNTKRLDLFVSLNSKDKVKEHWTIKKCYRIINRSSSLNPEKNRGIKNYLNSWFFI